MAEVSKTIEKYEKPKTAVPNLCMDAMKTSSCTSSSVPTSPVSLRKSSSGRRHNCLCSPTTHAGSFRCRYHRTSGLTHSSMSVGSKLSELASKPTGMCDGPSHIHLISSHRQSASSATYLPA
ncbi:hypothetical protein CDL12_06942 [Handroanthus impetiginosus]|uniref:Uncharacterized protein n=1 Tax=Handroanthus impetiginosus TaxID=429701 RepID=A0A2G9HS63_9LAMI|nr:hypothetical protein CDL12_06942 [Handroanthus impetiginosus]